MCRLIVWLLILWLPLAAAAQVLDGSYRPWLAEAAFGTPRWQSVGLAG